MTVRCPDCGHTFETHHHHGELGSYCPNCGSGFLGGTQP
jgi:ribosomal protein S27E